MSFLNLTDEEYAKLTPEQIEEMSKETSEDNSNTDADNDPANNQDKQDEQVKDDGTKVEDNDDDSEDSAAQGAEGDASADAEADAEGVDQDKGEKGSKEADKDVPANKNEEVKKDVAEDKKADKSADKSEVKDEKVNQDIDYKAAYEKLTSTFKANGRDMKVDNVDEAITLMQMGANYNKKMAALKPNLALIRMLENNGLLSEEKISFLIDLDKKNPEAINKLIKDSGIDPMDLSADKAERYKAGDYRVNEQEIALDQVMDEIQNSSGFVKTIETVKAWDVASKGTIAKTPEILRVINAHVESGAFEIIMGEMDKQRALGRLSGVSDIEAYRQVGDAINARGGFDHLGRQGQQDTGAKKVITPEPKKVDDDKTKDKRRAAAPAKPTTPSPTNKPDFNPLSLSDEEFMKQVQSKFI